MKLAQRLRAKIERKRAAFSSRKKLACAPERPILTVTFDDFPKSALTHGAPILEAFGGRGVYYACAGLIGGENHLGALYDWDDARALQENGHELACHTRDHWSALEHDPEAMAANCTANRAAFAEQGLGELVHFAFPYGEASAAAKARLAQDYDTLRVIDGGAARGAADLAYLPAYPLVEEAAAKRALLDAALALAERPAWLIVYGHDVRENPSEWGARPETLAELAAAATGAGAEILTLSEALERLRAPRPAQTGAAAASAQDDDVEAA